METWNPKTIKKGDLVRIVRHDGSVSDQRYQVEKLIEGSGLLQMSQWPSTAPKGMRMAWETYHVGGLIVDNNGPELLADRFRRK